MAPLSIHPPANLVCMAYRVTVPYSTGRLKRVIELKMKEFSEAEDARWEPGVGMERLFSITVSDADGPTEEAAKAFAVQRVDDVMYESGSEANVANVTAILEGSVEPEKPEELEAAESDRIIDVEEVPLRPEGEFH